MKFNSNFTQASRFFGCEPLFHGCGINYVQLVLGVIDLNVKHTNIKFSEHERLGFVISIGPFNTVAYFTFGVWEPQILL